jgi:DNA-binding transcriptional ArsR family regulator
MGLLDKLLGNKVNHPPLPAGNEAMAALRQVKAPLEELAHKVSDHMEVLPAGHEAFVFLGKPPKKFGIAWIHDGKVTGLKELAEEHHLSQLEMGKLIVRLGEAYEQASDSPRYSAEFGGKQMVVIPSQSLQQEVRQIMVETMAA